MENTNSHFDGISTSVSESSMSKKGEHMNEIKLEDPTKDEKQDKSNLEAQTPDKKTRNRLSNEDLKKAKINIEKLYNEKHPLLYIQIKTKLSHTKFNSLLTELFLENKITATIPLYDLVETTSSIKSLIKKEDNWKYVIVEKDKDHIKLTKYDFNKANSNNNTKSENELGEQDLNEILLIKE